MVNKDFQYFASLLVPASEVALAVTTSVTF